VRKLSRREGVLLTLAAVGLLIVGIRLLPPRAVVLPLRTRATPRPEPLPEVPRIDLARLGLPRSAREAGRRNLFSFGVARVEERREEPVVVATPPPMPVVPPGMSLGPGGILSPSLPPLNVKYIGSVENAHGVKVAVLVTDHREVLAGQAGQVVANRYRIARIGLESVDLEDVSSGQSRRVPLKGD
jgi:hypothetical protein